jgi:class 3 adenylate cyclase
LIICALAARIAIDSGPAVVDATGKVFGDVPNIAARAQVVAEPVVVTARMQRAKVRVIPLSRRKQGFESPRERQ